MFLGGVFPRKLANKNPNQGGPLRVTSPENERMPPQNQWLEDVFPTEIVPF